MKERRLENWIEIAFISVWVYTVTLWSTSLYFSIHLYDLKKMAILSIMPQIFFRKKGLVRMGALFEVVHKKNNY